MSRTDTARPPRPAAATGARDVLRRETRTAHDRVDALYAHHRLDDRTGYTAFLHAQATAFFASEAALDRAGAADALPDWPGRRRADLLRADLAELGVPAPVPGFLAHETPAFPTLPAILGGVYVLEGSRLGGAMLVRAVPVSFPRRFLGAAVPGAWRELIQAIDDRVQSQEDVREAVAAARQVFALFERAGRVKVM